MAVFTRVHLVSENQTVTVRRNDTHEYLVISSGTTEITISGPGYVGRQIQDAIASAYAELQRADEQQAGGTRLPQVGIGSRVDTAQIVICKAQPVGSGSRQRRVMSAKPFSEGVNLSRVTGG